MSEGLRNTIRNSIRQSKISQLVAGTAETDRNSPVPFGYSEANDHPTAADRDHLNDREGPLACVTLDLENDWYFDEPGYDHLTLEYLDEFIALVDRLDVPLTVFVVGSTLETYPEEVDRLRTELPCEFHLHSYQHDTSKNYDFRDEIRRGKRVFRDYFEREPIGYRAPQGNIESHEFDILEEEGFRFDSSVFPSYRPGVYSNLNKPIEPYQPSRTEDLIEIPVGVTARTRVPVCLSYLKVLGRPYQTYLRWAPLPTPLVFNVHLQDLYWTRSYDKLPQGKRLLFERNLGRSVELFEWAINLLQDRGYSFRRMSEIYNTAVNVGSIPKLVDETGDAKTLKWAGEILDE